MAVLTRDLVRLEVPKEIDSGTDLDDFSIALEDRSVFYDPCMIVVDDPANNLFTVVQRRCRGLLSSRGRDTH